MLFISSSVKFLSGLISVALLFLLIVINLSLPLLIASACILLILKFVKKLVYPNKNKDTVTSNIDIKSLIFFFFKLVNAKLIAFNKDSLDFLITNDLVSVVSSVFCTILVTVPSLISITSFPYL